MSREVHALRSRGITAFVLDLLVSVLGSLLLRALHVADGPDVTRAGDCGADEHDPTVEAIEGRAAPARPQETVPPA